MKKIILGILLLCFAGCSDDDSLACKKTIVDNTTYSNIVNDEFTITDVTLVSNCIKITIEYGGGCGEAIVDLIAEEDIFESSPVQRNIQISFSDNDDCEALIKKEYHFSVTPLRVENENTVQLNIENYPEPILFEY